MKLHSFAVMIIAATAVLLACPPETLAHGVHGPVSPPDGSAYAPPAVGWWENLYSQAEQNISAMLKNARDSAGFGPLLSLLALAFGYGVLHAVGPGHGKILLASYMTATNAPVPLGIAMALAAAAIQAAIAIAVVLIVAVGLQGVESAVPALQNSVSMLSLALLTSLGGIIVLRQLAALNWLPQPIARIAPASACACCGHDDHAHGASHHHHKHHHHDQHSHGGQGYGAHSHARRNEPLSVLGVIGVIFSMGARPCTSAFAILLLALANDLLLLGIAATLAMVLGVASTLVLIAVFSVDIRERASAALKHGRLPDNAMTMLSLVAGALLTAVAFTGLVRAAAA